jgi:hypothetical protein
LRSSGVAPRGSSAETPRASPAPSTASHLPATKKGCAESF